VQRGCRASRHSESRVLIVGFQFDVAIHVPIHAHRLLSRRLRRSRGIGNVGEGVAVDAELTVAHGEFERSEVAKSSVVFGGVARADSAVRILLSGGMTEGWGMFDLAADRELDVTQRLLESRR
jgi:hypothetical protein